MDENLISRVFTLYYLKHSVFNKKNCKTYKETRKHGPYTGKNNQSLVIILGEGNGNPLQYSCLENSMHRGAAAAKIILNKAKTQNLLKNVFVAYLF